MEMMYAELIGDNKKQRIKNLCDNILKTFLTAIIFIILMLTEPEYSEFYSVAPTRELSSIIKKEMSQLIEKSPLISKHFEVLTSEIRCSATNSKFVPLATTNNTMDGRLATAYVADEVEHLPPFYRNIIRKNGQNRWRSFEIIPR